MLRQDVQAAVDHGSESESVEYKSSFDSNSPADWAEIIKDIVALANSGGGAIIFGRAHSDRARARPGRSRHRYLDRSLATWWMATFSSPSTAAAGCKAMRCPRRSCGRCFKPYAVAAGVPGIAPHDTRRSYAKFRREAGADLRMVRTWAVLRLVQLALLAAPERLGAGGASATRSEEHTSELQSLRHLVCRLLLEKKKRHMHGDPDQHAPVTPCAGGAEGVQQ